MDLPKRLMLENRAWADEMARREPDFFASLRSGQQPDVFWIGCSDSRVPAERITNAAPGELFVHRSIANLARHDDNSLTSALHYAIDVLKVRHVIVCGHDGCGGVRAAFLPDPEADDLADAGPEGHPLAERIRPLRRLLAREQAQFDGLQLPAVSADPRLGTWVDRLVTLNVAEQVDLLGRMPVVRSAWRREQALYLHGWVYGLADGRLREVLRQAAPAEIA